MNTVLESLFILGISHHKTPLDVRERLALTEAEATELQKQIYLGTGIRECVVLNTCNRIEIYALAEDLSELAVVRSRLCLMKGFPENAFAEYAYSYNNLQALQHIMEVSAGLDSQIIGETEILGQLKQAYTMALQANTTDKVLNRVFEKSFHAAKEARRKTWITRGQISIGNVSVDLAARIFGKLSDSRILLIGSGEIAEKTAQALKSRGVRDISVSSRTLQNACKLAGSLEGTAIHFDNFKNQLHHFDIIICSTAAPSLLLDKGCLLKAMKQRPDQPCFIIDLALPRDVDPSADSIENVYLYNLDDLSGIADKNLEARKADIENARRILKKHAWNLWLQLRRSELMRRV